MMRCRIIVLSIAIALMTLVLGQAVFANAQSYVDRPRMIKAGVLVPDSSIGAMPAASYLFFLMGMRDDLKPNGWSFENPLSGGSDAYKSSQNYWMVPLSQTSLENLAKFDVLYMSSSGLVQFKTGDRDKLRRYVDGGGCLWVDNQGGMSFPTTVSNGFFIPQVNFTAATTAGAVAPFQRLHPLLTNPFWLNQIEITKLGDIGLTNSAVDCGLGGTWDKPETMPSPNALSPVLMNGTNVVCGAIEYGSGRVVFTSGFVGGLLGGSFAVPGAAAGITGNAGALKFAYNVVAYASSYTTFRKDYRRTGVLCDGLDAPLIYKWSSPRAMLSGSIGSESSAVIWKNVVFFSSGSTLYAMDLSPDTDLDNDGNPDDGLPNGTPAVDGNSDIIWKADCGAEISTPTVVTTIDPLTKAQNDFVAVNCRNGHVYAFEALPANTKGYLSANPLPRDDLWPNSFELGAGASALLPVVAQNGWLYATGTDGMLYGYSALVAASGNNSNNNNNNNNSIGLPTAGWSIPLWNTPSGTAYSVEVKHGPAMAFIKNQTTGAVTQSLSYLGRFTIPGSTTNVYNDRIFSVPVFVSGDKLTPVTAITSAASNTAVAYWTSNRQLFVASYPPPEAWAVDETGSGPREFQLTVTLTGNPGQVNVTSPAGEYLGPSTVVYMSYANDFSKVLGYTPPNYELQPKIAAINPGPGQSSQDIVTTATPAIGPDDRYYFGIKWNGTKITNPGSGKSSVYAVWFDGNSSTARLEWSYFLHGCGPVPDPTKGPTTTATVPLDSVAPLTKQLWGVHAKIQAAVSGTPDPTLYPVKNLEVNTTPAVSGNKVFVTATTSDPGQAGLSHGYLLCFKAHPTFQIRLNRPLIDFQNNNRRMDVKIWQPDYLFDSSSATQTAFSGSFHVPSSMIDYDTGTITLTDFSKVRMAGWLGAVQTSSFTPSLPVWVFVDNLPVPMEQIDYSGWDNLLWACPMPDHDGHPCNGISSSPVILGDYVYFTDEDGYMYAVSVDATAKDPYTKLLDPSASDSKTWMPMRDRIGATTGTDNVSLAGSNGTLIIPTTSGLYAFKNDKSLVTDNRRVLELGSDQRISWSCDAITVPTITLKDGSGHTVTTSLYDDIGPTNLSKPVVAQKLGSSDYLVVDSGNDRILRIERSGEITWALRSFNDDFRHLLRSGESLKLRGPADATMWNEFEQVGTDWFYMVHCLVVDSGNFRILDIVDRYKSNDKFQILGAADPDGKGVAKHELNWISYTSYKDKNFTFNSAQVVPEVENQDTTPLMTDKIWAAVSNYGLGTASATTGTQSTGGGQLGGAIVRMQYRKSNGNYGWDYYNPDTDSGKIVSQLTTITEGGTTKALSGPKYVQVLDWSTSKMLICDSSAVYLTQGPNGNVLAELTDKEYQALNRQVTDNDTKNPLTGPVPIPLQPQRAQLLPNGDILITNGYAGRIFDPLKSKFTGEVFETDGQLDKLVWYSPEMWWMPNAVGELPGGNGSFLQKLVNAPNLDQPTCAQRLQ